MNWILVASTSYNQFHHDFLYQKTFSYIRYGPHYYIAGRAAASHWNLKKCQNIIRFGNLGKFVRVQYKNSYMLQSNCRFTVERVQRTTYSRFLFKSHTLKRFDWWSTIKTSFVLLKSGGWLKTSIYRCFGKRVLRKGNLGKRFLFI